jgi:proteasome lid subunit RPN8/RPN11
MWARGLFCDILDVVNKGKAEGDTNTDPAVAEKKFPLGSLESISTIGPPLWGAEFEEYYELPQKESAPDSLEATSAGNAGQVLNKRRVNQVTSKGRMSASVLYQELSKPLVDEHRLVAPYDYGEQFGAAEHLAQPYRICVHPQVGFLCDVHGHLCDAEVIGLLAGKWDAAKKELYIQAPFPCSATERHFDLGYTDVELDSEAEWKVREAIAALNLEVVGWYHSHPKFRPDPSVVDILNQQQYQCFSSDEEQGNPFVGLIVSTYDPQLPSPAANHQWFTVVPFSPSSGNADESNMSSHTNSMTDLLGKAEIDDANSTTATKAPGTPLPVLYMPVRMEVEYYNVALDRFPGTVEGSGTVNTGFTSKDSADARGLLHALQSLRLESSRASPEQGSSSLLPDGVAAEQGLDADAQTSVWHTPSSSPRIKRPKGAVKESTSREDLPSAELQDDEYWSSSIAEAAPLPMAAPLAPSRWPKPNVDKPTLTPAVSDSSISKIPSGLDALTIEEGTGSWATNSLAGSVSESGDDSRAQRTEALKGTKKASKVTLLLPGIVTPAEDGARPESSTNASTITSANDSGVVTPKEEPISSAAGVASVDADHEIAMKMAEQQAEEQAATSRRPSRAARGRERFGDFVDSLTALDNRMLRKQDVAKVVAAEKKERLLAKRAKEVLEGASPGSEGDASKKKRGRVSKKDMEGAAAAGDALTISPLPRGPSGVPPKGKKRTKACKSCPPVLAAVSAGALLCAPSVGSAKLGKPMTKKRSQASIKSETSSSTSEPLNVESVHTSILLALQEPTLRSSALARDMLCTALPPYRGLVLTLISMGMYYSRLPRRNDLHKPWRSMTRLGKLKASSAVWCARLGLQHGGTSALVQAFDGEGVLTKSALALTVEQTEQYLLIEWLGVFLTACWEDYSKSRKRKNSV